MTEPSSTALLDRGPDVRRHGRIRIGFYMHAPRIGGAETYLRDLLHGVDHDTFDVHVFIPPWREFAAFLGIDTSSDLHGHEVEVLEPATRFGRGADRPAQAAGFGTESRPSAVRRAAERLRIPPAALRVGHDALRYLTVPVNKRRLAGAFGTHDLDIVHVINGGYPGAASALAATLGARATARHCVMTVCGTPAPPSILGPVERAVDRAVAGAVEAVVVPAARPADALLRRGFRSRTIETIPWGVRGAPIVADPAAKSRFGLSTSSRVVSCIANFTPTKGQATIVDALPLLVERFADVVLLLAGDGPQRAEVERLARAHGIADRVRFLGRFEEPWDILRASDVFVLASHTEGLPLVVLEAMSQGKPVVATDVGGMPEAVIEGETGLLVAPRDPRALACAIGRILADGGMAQRMGAAGRDRYEQRYTMAAMIDAHQALYLRVAAP